MFTGIVESLGSIESISHGGSSLVLSIKCAFADELVLGESVAVNGTCLTVTSKSETSFTADVTPESFRRTSLGELECGSSVNLERAMRADGRFGGHIVSGHIDGTGKFLSAQKEENAVNISVSVPPQIGRYIIEKGSVCIDGISLTVASVSQNGVSAGAEVVFSVAVIPHTWENTTLSRKQSGAKVNIECDVVGKYIEHFLKIPAALDSDTEKSRMSDEEIQGFMQNFPSFH